MDWIHLLNTTRLRDPEYQERPGRPMYMQDIDRITFSAPFRRLANKTQVHPLYDNDHVHHRLIHSLEVSSVGRSLGIEVGQWLVDEQVLGEAQRDKISGVVQAACLAHDIGNPPFGHSGEEAIGRWFEERFAAPKGVVERLDPKYRQEFRKFEGNAQGFRILARNEMYVNEGGMRLSLAVLGAFTKYPATANISAARPEAYCGLKKYGLFENDTGLFAEAATALGLPTVTTSAGGLWWRRHPLVFLMEAADDICYNIMDLEDAFTCGDVPFDQAESLLSALFAKSNREHSYVSKAANISALRARAVTGAIAACVEAFKAHYAALMDGTFSGSLIEVSAKAEEFNRIKEIARERIFKAPRKTELEVFGRNVIYRTLDGLIPLFDDLSRTWKAEELSSYHQQLARALGLHLEGIGNAYDALHALTDFVSGMTDRYAVKVSEMLYGR